MHPPRRPSPSRKPAAPAEDRPFDPQAFLPFAIIVAGARVTDALNARCLAPHGLTLAEWRVVTLAGLHDGISATEIGRRAVLDKVKVSRAVAALVQRGLLRQAQNKEDARARRLHVTRRGRTVLDRLAPDARAFEAAVGGAFTAGELAALRTALDKLAAI